MRALCKGVIAIGLASWIVGAVDAQPAPPTACPATTQVESTAIARAWHDDVINRRNPAMLRDIVGPEVVHHAAGGYPKVLNAEGIAAMMGDFLVAFPDLLITFDQFIAKDDFVVERYTFRIACGRIVEVWSEVDAEGRRRQLTVPLTTPGR